MGEIGHVKIPWPDWKVVCSLGHGDYGHVYEIERELFGRKERAALEVIPIPRDQNEVELDYSDGYDEESIVKKYFYYLEKIIKEYQLMVEMKGHSNIVSCDDLSTVPCEEGIGWTVYIRMELFTPLTKVIRNHVPSERETVKLGKDICQALSLCEKKSIVHRNVTPESIMVSESGDYKLGNFSVARVMEYATNATRAGTPNYWAPEVNDMKKYGKEVDIYSLGIVLYTLLNNKKMPFIGADEELNRDRMNWARKKRYQGEKLPEPKYGSPELKQVVLKACEYRPENRYRNAGEMLQALEALTRDTYHDDFFQATQDVHVAGKITGDFWNDTQNTIGAPRKTGNAYEDSCEISKTVGSVDAYWQK